ncbi:MAG: hypothetical protein A2857_03570 [Candidatus Levybacteria bacterium RIFCSPHIGHO2_01_FULL_36_15]|nr:MAG: hypothetical protein A2857_03570 [Candidatus Levybacteria bacterium RIFCSPHIGHO2_01_FULL_36_15]
MKNLVDEYIKVRLEFIEIVNKFPENKRGEILFDKWSLKDTIAHLSGWAAHQIEVLEDIKNNKVPKYPGHSKDYNNNEVSRRSKWSWKKVYKEFISCSNQLVNKYSHLPKSLVNKRIWPEKRFTPRIYFEFEIEHYTKTHLPQIKKILYKF